MTGILERQCRLHGVDALYLFGSRAEDGRRAIEGDRVDHRGSDLDVGVFFGPGVDHLNELPGLQVDLEDVFAPLRVDLVPLASVDALFQFRAIDGHRLFAADSERADRRELVIMRRAAELLPVQRAIERERFGVATS
ncbi:MAG: nucleotidyltransferase domain-containing protein [Acidobacteriota bacterium]